MKISFLFFLLYLNLFGLNLKEVYVHTLNNSLQLQEAQIKLESKQFATQKVRSNLYPDVSWNYSYGRDDTSSSTKSDIRDNYNHDYGLSAVQNLYNNSLSLDIEKEDLNLDQEKLNFENAKQSLILNLSQKYFELLTIEQKYKTAKKDLELFNMYETKTRKLFELELASKTDLLKAISEQTKAQLEYDFLKIRISQKRKILEKLTKTKIDNLQNLLTNEFFEVESLEYYIELLNNNIEIKTTKISAQMQKKEFQRYDSYMQPTINLVANYSKTSRDDDTYYDNKSVKIQLQGKLYKGGYNKYAKKEALRLYSSFQKHQELLNEINLEELIELNSQLKSYKNNYKSLGKDIQTFQNELKFQKKAHQLGIKDIEELVSTQKKLSELKYQRFENYTSAIIMYLKMNFLVSNLNETIIDKINSLLENSK